MTVCAAYVASTETSQETLFNMRIVDINQQPVELYKILKFEGMAASGAEAKTVIADGLVKVNDITETRKRKKIIAGDTIEFGDEKILIQLQV
jgi:ribosome-associated protein